MNTDRGGSENSGAQETVRPGSAGASPVRLLVLFGDTREFPEVRSALRTDQAHHELVAAYSMEEGQTLAEEQTFDAAIVDFRLPDGDGIEFLHWLRERALRLPVLFVSSSRSPRIAAEAMQLGAVEYLHKDESFTTVLPLVLRHVVERARLDEERRSLARRLARSEHLAALGTLVGGFAHNLNNPLTTVSTFLDLLPTRYESDEKFRGEFYGRAKGDLVRVQQMIASMVEALGVGATSPDERWPVADLVAELESSLSGALGAKSIELRTRVDVPLPWMTGSRESIKQALVVLLDNAIEFSPLGKGIVLGVSVEREVDADRICFEVVDQGPGVDAQEQTRIFDPFYSTRPGGLGMGLFIADCVARHHGGSLEVASADGGGALFRFLARLDG